jgi:hypothetical protein
MTVDEDIAKCKKAARFDTTEQEASAVQEQRRWKSRVHHNQCTGFQVGFQSKASNLSDLATSGQPIRCQIAL